MYTYAAKLALHEMAVVAVHSQYHADRLGYYGTLILFTAVKHLHIRGSQLAILSGWKSKI